MGFDITAYDLGEQEIAYLRTYMGAFRMCSEQGYDWFGLIDAYDCYGWVSGDGKSKDISLTNLLKAMRKLKTHNTNGKLANNSWGDKIDLRDEWRYRKPMLRKFMRKCINWCLCNNQKEIDIYFG